MPSIRRSKRSGSERSPASRAAKRLLKMPITYESSFRMRLR